jgi:hypothetical protein
MMFSPLIYFKYLISRSAVKFMPRWTYIGLIRLIATLRESARRSAEKTLPQVPSPSSSPFKYFDEMLMSLRVIELCNPLPHRRTGARDITLREYTKYAFTSLLPTHKTYNNAGQVCTCTHRQSNLTKSLAAKS